MIIMETNAYDQKLNKYELDDQIVYTGFSSIKDAQEHADKIGGNLVEVGFKDGNDNPQITSEAGLIKKNLHYYVDAGDEYKFIHSSDPGFKQYADDLQKMQAKMRGDAPDERYLANFEIENTEDPIVVIKNDKLESVTSRERSKYLKNAHVYEIGVSTSKS